MQGYDIKLQMKKSPDKNNRAGEKIYLQNAKVCQIQTTTVIVFNDRIFCGAVPLSLAPHFPHPKMNCEP